MQADHNKNPLARILLIVILLLAGISLALAYWGWIQNSSHMKQVNALRAELDEITSLMANIEIRYQADNLMLIGEADSALALYAMLAESTNDSSLYLERSAWVDSLHEMAAARADQRFWLRQMEEHQEARQREMEHMRDSILKELETVRQGIDSIATRETRIADSLEAVKLALASFRERSGMATFKTPRGTQVRYLGELKHGKASGFGIGIFETGGYYEGQWADNQRHGRGNYTWDDGDRYEGDYKGDTRTGYGVYYFKSGEKYVGEWHQDQRNGYGTLFDKRGNVKFRGSWEKDYFRKADSNGR